MRYAAIETTTTQTWVPGDERSRTNPGHGYPEGYETHTTITMHEFDTIEQLTAWLTRQQQSTYSRDRKYRLIQFDELQAQTTISVAVVPA
jgi:hypothetical protein